MDDSCNRQEQKMLPSFDVSRFFDCIGLGDGEWLNELVLSTDEGNPVMMRECSCNFILVYIRIFIFSLSPATPAGHKNLRHIHINH